MLTSQDHRHFLEHGYLVVKNAVPPKTIEAALAVLDAETYSGHVGGADYQAVKSETVNACITDTIHDAIGDLFGPDYPFVRSRQADDMPRAYQPDAGWPPPKAHIDDDYPTLMPNGWAVGLFVFLTPVQPHGGAFVLFPGSYRRYQELLSADPDAITSLVVLPENAGTPQEYLAEPGDIVLFHHFMGHAGSNNVSNPQTRHALLSRWHPARRIVPGDRPLEAMSTIEKANSARAQRIKSSGKQEEAVLREGWASANSILTYALLQTGGKAHLFLTEDASGPEAIRHYQSPDLLNWEAMANLPASPNPIWSLSIYRRGFDIRLLTGTETGTEIRSSTDLDGWTTLGNVFESWHSAGPVFFVFNRLERFGDVLYAQRRRRGLHNVVSAVKVHCADCAASSSSL